MAYMSSQLERISDAINNPEPAEPAPQSRVLTVDRCGGCYAPNPGNKCNYCGTIYREQEGSALPYALPNYARTVNERRELHGLGPLEYDDGGRLFLGILNEI